VSLTWVREEMPRWDADKQRVIGGAPEGTFVIPFKDGEELPGEWFSAREGDLVVGYGRLDITWGGDAEIWIAVDSDHQQQGVGSFVLDQLEHQAAARDINYVYNTIRQHDGRELVHDWLVVRGFRGPLDGDLRKRVGSHPAAGVRAQPSNPVAAYDPVATGDLGPGHEESGGYVNIDEHQY
jgi:GNAT superfamily N-acetyltransferase